MKLKYDLEEIPPFSELLLLGLQWLAITVPLIIIIGKAVAQIQFENTTLQVFYLQKMFFITALYLLIQLFWGHRLPVIVGPATVLLIGIVASQTSGFDSIYSSIAIGGLALMLISVSGLFAKLKKLFTVRVVAGILLLIAVTLAPTIMNLISASSSTASSFANICFALLLTMAMFLANKYLQGTAKSLIIVISMIAGTLVYALLFGLSTISHTALPEISLSSVGIHIVFNPAVVISFLIGFVALAVNDLGSIQAVGELIGRQDMERRITRGITVTGLSNMLAGLFGVIGMVDFSLSPGVIASTGYASRFTLIPTGIGLLVLSFLPAAIAFLSSIPEVIIGSILLYVMCSQIAAGLFVAFNSLEEFTLESGLVVGLPLMLGIIISFLPAATLDTFPETVRPFLGNGFVVGIIAVLIMEHLIFRSR